MALVVDERNRMGWVRLTPWFATEPWRSAALGPRRRASVPASPRPAAPGPGPRRPRRGPRGSRTRAAATGSSGSRTATRNSLWNIEHMFDSVRSWAPHDSGTPAPSMPPQQGKRPLGAGPHQHHAWPPGPGPPPPAGTSSCPCSPPSPPSSPGGVCSGVRVVTVGVGDGPAAPGAAGPRRGRAGGGTTLAFALLAAASTASWCAAVGTADPGIVALAELGVDLGRLVLVPRPGPLWAQVAATLFDGVDVVLVRPPGSGAAGGGPAAGRPGPRAPGRAGGAGVPGVARGGRRPADRGGRGVAGGRGRPRPSAGPPPGGRGRRPAGRARPVRVGLWLPTPSGQVAGPTTPTARGAEAQPEQQADGESGGGRCSGCSPSGAPASLRSRSAAARPGRSAPWWRPWSPSPRASTRCAPGCAPCPPGARPATSGGTGCWPAWPPTPWPGTVATTRSPGNQPGWGWPTACSRPSWPPGLRSGAGR